MVVAIACLVKQVVLLATILGDLGRGREKPPDLWAILLMSVHTTCC